MSKQAQKAQEIREVKKGIISVFIFLLFLVLVIAGIILNIEPSEKESTKIVEETMEDTETIEEPSGERALNLTDPFIMALMIATGILMARLITRGRLF